MTKFKPLVVVASLLFAITLLIPALLVLPFSDEKASGVKPVKEEKPDQEAAAPPSVEPSIDVSVFRMSSKAVETLSFEEYLIGVVSAEMPADFEKEALKAQALAARTYITKHIMDDKQTELPGGAMITDTVTHQVYKNKTELKKQWKKDYDWKLQRVTEAVRETSGQILTYDGQPITAAFFSTSNGYTENAEFVWTSPAPYLESVESPWDIGTPKFTDEKVIPISDFERRLGVKVPDGDQVGSFIETTAGNRVGRAEINGTKIKGVDIRDKLGLKSTDFNWKRSGNDIIIQTKGYGHGVGMSQYGANGMAEEGKDYKEIVTHYYKGVEISKSDTMLAKVTAKK
ncbi:stage II sporulation protein D [Cytobacillus purgationiresistens]|uniref:Stage II sporulation protein D n=1 Tax=Cytobacillus purgationiresistens TaxID=863449 RepID=A0ABU0ADB3_9BACI|nr:stage II sporulation protein D [Cytobacillus purgationiresistens]MDQ0269237.1 stage II sporulation protein D [Cytobacillus purgationiresistens]